MGKMNEKRRPDDKQLSAKAEANEVAESTGDADPAPGTPQATIQPLPPIPNIPIIGIRELDGPILDNKQLRTAIQLTKLTHSERPGLQIWVGDVGAGKTVAAEQLEKECIAAADRGDEGAYRAHKFTTGGDLYSNSTRKMKRGIYDVYCAEIGALTPGELQARTEKALVDEIVEDLRLRSMQLLIIDEAGMKTMEEIRGFAAITDAALSAGFRLTILLLGMDDLGGKATGMGVLESRIKRIYNFELWSSKNCLAFACSRTVRFANLLRGNSPEVSRAWWDLMDYTKGEPRTMDTLLPDIERRLAKGHTVGKSVSVTIKARREELHKARSRGMAPNALAVLRKRGKVA